MATAPAQKLKIKEGYRLLTLNAPADFARDLAPAPTGLTISPTLKSFDQVHWFVLNKAQLEKELDKILKLVKGEVVCWVYYPKGTSKVQTDLTRDKGWEKLLSHNEFTWISLISFNDTWSTFAFRLKSEADKKKEAKPAAERAIFQYIDPAKKIVRLPDDLEKAFAKNKKAATAFEMLSFTNKKEYVEWVVSAKREETRAERIKGTLERLNKGWKNPANR